MQVRLIHFNFGCFTVVEFSVMGVWLGRNHSWLRPFLVLQFGYVQFRAGWLWDNTLSEI